MRARTLLGVEFTGETFADLAAQAQRREINCFDLEISGRRLRVLWLSGRWVSRDPQSCLWRPLADLRPAA